MACICGSAPNLACIECQAVLYCSKTCQRKDWRRHMECECGRLALNVFEAARTNTELHADDLVSEPTRLSASVSYIPAGGKIAAETHHHLSQAVIVLTGHGQAREGVFRTLLEPGSIVMIQQGVSHEIRANAEGPMTLVSVYAKDLADAGWNHK